MFSVIALVPVALKECLRQEQTSIWMVLLPMKRIGRTWNIRFAKSGYILWTYPSRPIYIKTAPEASLELCCLEKEWDLISSTLSSLPRWLAPFLLGLEAIVWGSKTSTPMGNFTLWALAHISGSDSQWSQQGKEKWVRGARSGWHLW